MNPNPTPDRLPRLAPDVPLPPYTYVNGRSPHPLSDPAGHSYGLAPDPVPALDPERWRESRTYLVGIDLFNHGFYWEAHEAWERLWHACQRKGPVADFLKALIKLAAAGVKARERRLEGVRTHAVGAAKLFRGVADQLGAQAARCLGLSPEHLAARAATVASRAEDAVTDLPAGPVFPFFLSPNET